MRTNLELLLGLSMILAEEELTGEDAWFVAQHRGWIYAEDIGDVTMFHVTEKGQAIVREWEVARAAEDA